LRDEVWEPREARREQLRHGEFANILNGSPDGEAAFSAAWRSPIRPLSPTFAAFVALLVEASADPKDAVTGPPPAALLWTTSGGLLG
jgi:hypothetical protein